jgi:hypothetical protein
MIRRLVYLTPGFVPPPMATDLLPPSILHNPPSRHGQFSESEEKGRCTWGLSAKCQPVQRALAALLEGSSVEGTLVVWPSKFGMSLQHRFDLGP